MIDVAAQSLLGTHVRHGSHDDAGAGHHLGLIAAFRFTWRRRELCESEVQHFYVAARRQHQVGRLDVAMHDAFGMRFVQRVAHLDANGNQFGKRERTTFQPNAQRLAFHIFHGEKAEAMVFADFVNVRDVGVSERRSQPGFLHKTMHTFRVRRHARGQNLESDTPAERSVVGQIDGAHAAFAQARNHVVVRDAGTRRQWIGHDFIMANAGYKVIPSQQQNDLPWTRCPCARDSHRALAACRERFANPGHAGWRPETPDQTRFQS